MKPFIQHHCPKTPILTIEPMPTGLTARLKAVNCHCKWPSVQVVIQSTAPLKKKGT